MARRRKQLTRGQRNIIWIERYCVIPEGPKVGQPFKLAAFQKAEILRIYDNPHGTRTAIISMGRKNAKTTICAALLLLHLVGPEALPNGQLFSAAQSLEQAAILFALAAKMVRASPSLAGVVTIRDTKKQLFCAELGTLYRALSAEKATSYGLSPVFIVHDELGQVKGPTSELYDALETATGAQAAPLSVVISTQAPTDAGLLSVLIDDALSGADPQTVVSLYTAPLEDEKSEDNPDGCDPFSEEHIRKANPAYGTFLNRDKVMRDADKARRMPTFESSFRNLVLNQRVDASTPFISRATWAACTNPAGYSAEPQAHHEVFIGLDLSSVNDLTAKVAVFEDRGFWFVRPTFWLPEHGLREKAQSDRVAYDVWADQGHLETTPGKTVDYAFVAATIWDDCQRFNVRKIGYDRWQFAHLRTFLTAAGFTDGQFDGDDPLFVPLGQGFQTMSPALRALEADVLNHRLVHLGHPVLTMCAANAVVTQDPAGNRKLDKAKAAGRIDGMVALAMARSIAGTVRETHAQASPWDDPDFTMGD